MNIVNDKLPSFFKEIGTHHFTIGTAGKDGAQLYLNGKNSAWDYHKFLVELKREAEFEVNHNVLTLDRDAIALYIIRTKRDIDRLENEFSELKEDYLEDYPDIEEMRHSHSYRFNDLNASFEFPPEGTWIINQENYINRADSENYFGNVLHFLRQQKSVLYDFNVFIVSLASDFKVQSFQNKLFDIDDIDQEDAETEEENKEKLNLKQKIILLEYLGFLDLPPVKKLSTQIKGKLISYILETSLKNTTDRITYLNPPRIEELESKLRVKTASNIAKVKMIIEELKIEKL